MKNLNLQSTE